MLTLKLNETRNGRQNEQMQKPCRRADIKEDGLFSAFHFCEEAFKKMKTYFFAEKTLLHIFRLFPTGIFLQKHLIIKAEKTYLRNNTI